jgi:hypothetical protein
MRSDTDRWRTADIVLHTEQRNDAQAKPGERREPLKETPRPITNNNTLHRRSLASAASPQQDKNTNKPHRIMDSIPPTVAFRHMMRHGPKTLAQQVADLAEA